MPEFNTLTSKIIRIFFVLTISMVPLHNLAQEDLDFGLLEACADSSMERSVEFITQGANLNALTINGTTPLMYASAKGHIDLAMLLLDSGASIQAEEFYSNRTALAYAVMQNHVELSELLIRREANSNMRDWEGNSLLHYAVRYQYPTMADLLLYYEADINALNNDSNSVLHLAAELGDEAMALILLRAGIDTELRNINGQTALMYAIELGETNFAILLLEQGVNPGGTDLDGRNIFHQACINENFFLAAQLLKSGFNINEPIINQNLSLYDFARISHKPELRKFLRENSARSFHRFYIDKIELHWKNSFNLEDYFMGANLIARESYTNTSLSFGFNSRLRREAVLADTSDPIFQYWEKRHNFQLSLSKNFPLIRNRGTTTGAFLEAGEMFSFGFWDGTSTNPNSLFQFYPAIGIYLEGYYASARAGVEYYQFPNHSGSPYHIFLQLGINLKKYPF
jgi:ankyrin repeat protein